MNKQLFKIRLAIIGAMCLVALVSYLLIALPLKQELEKSIQQNFIYSAEGVVYSVENFIEHSMYAASSLSSATINKQAMVDFKNGELTLAELKAFIRPRYEENYLVIENLTGAVRIMDGTVIAEQGTVNWEKVGNVQTFEKISPQINTENLTITIYSPIKEQEEIIGYDIVFVGMSDLMYGVHEDHMQHEIYTADQLEKMLIGKKIIKNNNGEFLASDGTHSWYAKPLKSADYYFVASTSNHFIYSPIQSALAKIAFAFPLFIFLVIAIINYLAFKSIGRLADKLEEQKNWYKKIASTDYLTNTSSRHHFNEIIEEYVNGKKTIQSPIALVMIDVDGFKKINDTYGHLAGDEVLREIARALKASVRSEDKVLRYGGDEFLLFLKDCTFATAEKVLARAIKTLKTSSKFAFPIELSYGIRVVKNKDDFLQAIHDADAQMYKMKTKKSSQAVISPT
ncbi:MAG: GGDEF domain-containing protein [Firmicutes bacterium]|nr:GGDEF domain-containing protein [Bacillota bacterium]